MKRFIFRLVGHPAEAEDLAQEVFVRVFTKRTTYRPGAKFSTWCFAIAANQAKNRLRWWHRRPALSLDAWTEAGGETPDESRAGGAGLGLALVKSIVQLHGGEIEVQSTEGRGTTFRLLMPMA